MWLTFGDTRKTPGGLEQGLLAFSYCLESPVAAEDPLFFSHLEGLCICLLHYKNHTHK